VSRTAERLIITGWCVFAATVWGVMVRAVPVSTEATGFTVAFLLTVLYLSWTG